MNSISSVSFHGNGSESAGSLALKNQPVECPTCGRVNFRGNTLKSTGSLTDVDNPLEQPSQDTVNFRGRGSESTGSLANIDNPLEQPSQDTVNFKGGTKQDKRDTSVLGVFAGIALLAAGIIAGLGYAHKTNILQKMSDGKVKNFLSKAEPAAKKCHEWCATVKTKSTELWEKCKNAFSSKKS